MEWYYFLRFSPLNQKKIKIGAFFFKWRFFARQSAIFMSTHVQTWTFHVHTCADMKVFPYGLWINEVLPFCGKLQFSIFLNSIK